MSSISKQITVPYTADQMYDLVYDINSYSKFIPLCSSSEVREEQGHQSRATMKITKGKIGFEVTTVNTMEKGRSISINLENGPFKSLKGVWRFTPLGTHQCIVSLHFEFEFSNKLLDVALGGLFKQLCDSMIESFRKQAAIRYGAGQT
ncbi:MAG: type II toxin-antitoxin system RatA family toxin [Methylococcaceae bacterium]|nr:type II toxin-antitoxin system RatA family toxin [Methylococcaceae bacterium]